MAWLGARLLVSAEQQGKVVFNGLPVPGATVSAAHDKDRFVTTTDEQGAYSFSELSEGEWNVRVEMFGFVLMERSVNVSASNASVVWEMKLLPLDQMKARIEAAPVVSAPAENTPKQTADGHPAQQDLNERAADGLLINGSINNGAASPFSQLAAFGNTRGGGRGLYNGGIGLTFDNSNLDAAPFSLTGQATPKPEYNRLTGLLTFGGPLRILHLLRNGPYVFVGYQWTRNRNASTQPALVPNALERAGFFQQTIVDPNSGVPFVNNQVPANRVSPQAKALLNLYPLPNFGSGSGYNFQVPLVSATHQDALQSRFNRNIGSRDQVYGRFAFQSARTDTPSLFQFLDTTDTFGVNAGANWSHRFNHGLLLNFGYQYSYFSTRTKPYFAGRQNGSGAAGISGNNQAPVNWGPPSLIFSSGIAELSDAQSAFNRNETSAVTPSLLWNRRNHNVQLGFDFRRQQFNYLAQQNARGTFTFTGAATGVDFADFLIGVPDASAIAFGNADKYFRESSYAGYFTDDWRINAELTVNAGLRWEYGAPITELYGRLVNLDVAQNFSAVAPVLAKDALGLLTGERYPASLVRPDKHGVEPRMGIAWRPFSGSSMVIRAGYGIYDDTSVYQTIANQMAQQPPLSKNLSVQNSAADPLTLANGFNAAPAGIANTFAVDPNLRVGYAQNWQASVQRDLPASLQMTATYLGIKGTRALQEFLPNTYPAGMVNPCAACPVGFAYLTSNGNSARESAQIQVRRRLHNGFTGTLQYTFSKSIDDAAALGGEGWVATQQSSAPNTSNAVTVTPAAATGQQGLQIAQNWLNLRSERSLSSFDQRHLLTLQLQYTTGMGIGGGTLQTGWRGALLKEWTVATLVTAESGLPQTPIYLETVPGTGFTGTIRPDYTGQPVYASAAGRYLNSAAYAAPLEGQWGNAGRNSITGPSQFSLNVSFGRTFRITDKLNLDFRVDSTNALNHVTFTTWNTTVNSSQFGLAAAANAMRSMQTTLRLRF